MAIHPGSLQQRFTFFLILPVALLLVGMGVAVFFYARDLLLDEWREASVLKLQRAAHEMDMHLARIKDGIRLVHEASGESYPEGYHRWALEHLRRMEGVQQVALTWSEHDSEASAPPARRAGGIHAGHMRRSPGGLVREITPPVFDARGQHGTVTLISVLLSDRAQVLGRLEVTAGFDEMFRGVIESGWWQSSKAFLVDDQGRVLVCTVPGRHLALSETGDPLEAATFQRMQAAESGTVMGAGHPPKEVSGFYRLHEAPWVLVMIAPGEEILAPVIRARWGFTVAILLTVALLVTLIRLVTARAVRDIRRLSDAALKLSRGEFGDPLPIEGRDELAELVGSFNRMTRQLRERLELKRDLGLAKEVQQNLLPAGPPVVPGLDVAGRSVYCQETGGDYYDWIPVDGPDGEARLWTAVGDVVGHGLSAALLMTTVRALLRGRLDGPGDMAQKACDFNRLLCRDTAASGSFVTLFLLEIDLGRGRMEWVRGGHDPGLLYRARADEWVELGGPGMAFGVAPECVYAADHQSAFEPGDIVLIGTDGVWETQNAAGENFGKARVTEVVRAHRADAAEVILQAVLGALDGFRGQAPQEDDVTLVVIKAVGVP